jgi:hypothetical protein
LKKRYVAISGNECADIYRICRLLNGGSKAANLELGAKEAPLLLGGYHLIDTADPPFVTIKLCAGRQVKKARRG